MYAAHVLEETKNGTPRLEDFHVFLELRNFFPNEILGIPPKRDNDFTIELVPRGTPMYKTPYRMSTLEVLELKM